jgi:hypothetical protein
VHVNSLLLASHPLFSIPFILFYVESILFSVFDSLSAFDSFPRSPSRCSILPRRSILSREYPMAPVPTLFYILQYLSRQFESLLSAPIPTVSISPRAIVQSNYVGEGMFADVLLLPVPCHVVMLYECSQTFACISAFVLFLCIYRRVPECRVLTKSAA